MKLKKLFAGAIAAAMLCTVLAGCGGSKDDTIKIYDGQFSEMHILHRMVKLLVEEHTDAKVEILDEMAPPASYDAVVKGDADLMNSYDGTVLTTFLHLDVVDVPDGQTIYDFVNETASEKDGVHLLEPIGSENTYAIGVPEAIAEEYSLETISDLVEVADQLSFGAEHDFFTEEGSAKYNPFVEFYGLNFKEARQLDMNLKYQAIDNGEIDVTIVYTTDGLNIKSNLKVLEDDQNYFPEYNDALLVRNDLFDRLSGTAPNLEEVLNMLAGKFDNEIMTGLTYRVDVEGETADDVARDFLEQEGMIGGGASNSAV